MKSKLSGDRQSKSGVPVPLPDLGTAGEPVSLAAWLVEPGDAVEAGDRILEVVIPGITCDVRAPAAGIIGRLEKAIDAKILPGEIVAWIEPVGAPRISG
jgi:pyruvate/2-oxoglutarate dehydrogenase complex dihydrolipoamide acyltransferase (E2) component